MRSIVLAFLNGLAVGISLVACESETTAGGAGRLDGGATGGTSGDGAAGGGAPGGAGGASGVAGTGGAAVHASCSTSADCGITEDCIDGKCGGPCRTSSDCTNGNYCLGSGCVAPCAPSTKFCWGVNIMQCDATGRAPTVVGACPYQGQYCNPVATECSTGACPPGATYCDHETLSECNQYGNSKHISGNGCDLSGGEHCARNRCSECKSASAAAQVRLKEVGLGLPQYVVLENTGDCAVELNGMALSFDTASGDSQQFALPTFKLEGGHIATVGNDAVPLARSWDIPISQGLDYHGSTGGYVLLCYGTCSTASNVVDAFAFTGNSTSGAVAPPPLPAPITFAPLSTIASERDDDDSYQRVSYTGAFPVFQAADWTVAPARFSECLAANPGGSCTVRGVVCHLPTSTCTCTDAIGAVYYGWSCI